MLRKEESYHSSDSKKLVEMRQKYLKGRKSRSNSRDRYRREDNEKKPTEKKKSSSMSSRRRRSRSRSRDHHKRTGWSESEKKDTRKKHTSTYRRSSRSRSRNRYGYRDRHESEKRAKEKKTSVSSPRRRDRRESEKKTMKERKSVSVSPRRRDWRESERKTLEKKTSPSPRKRKSRSLSNDQNRKIFWRESQVPRTGKKFDSVSPKRKSTEISSKELSQKEEPLKPAPETSVSLVRKAKKRSSSSSSDSSTTIYASSTTTSSSPSSSSESLEQSESGGTIEIASSSGVEKKPSLEDYVFPIPIDSKQMQQQKKVSKERKHSVGSKRFKKDELSQEYRSRDSHQYAPRSEHDQQYEDNWLRYSKLESHKVESSSDQSQERKDWLLKTEDFIHSSQVMKPSTSVGDGFSARKRVSRFSMNTDISNSPVQIVSSGSLEPPLVSSGLPTLSKELSTAAWVSSCPTPTKEAGGSRTSLVPRSENKSHSTKIAETQNESKEELYQQKVKRSGDENQEKTTPGALKKPARKGSLESRKKKEDDSNSKRKKKSGKHDKSKKKKKHNKVKKSKKCKKQKKKEKRKKKSKQSSSSDDDTSSADNPLILRNIALQTMSETQIMRKVLTNTTISS